MADIRVPSNVSSITFTTSGVKAPTGGIVTGLTAAEATNVVQNYAHGPGSNPIVSTAANGDTILAMPPGITSITIGGQVRAVSGGVIASAVSGAIAAAYCGSRPFRQPFSLVSA